VSNLTGLPPRQKPQKPPPAGGHMAWVKTLPCCVCGRAGPSDAHHVIHDRYGTRRASDWEVVPLCREHHLGGTSAIHTGKETWREHHGPDWSYLPAVLELAGLSHMLAVVGRDADGKPLR